jgi:alpha-galactosidase
MIEGILTDAGYVEEAVNLPNKGLIANLPDWIVVEVPATVDGSGVRGVPLGELPHGFAGLLYNQVAVHDMTAEAVLKRSKKAALQALLVDPIVDKYSATVDLLDTMLDLQSEHLGYLE